MDFIVTHEANIRFGVFMTMIALMGGLELLIPKRPLRTPKTSRWLTNFSIVALDVLIVRLFVPVLPIGAAFWAQTQGYGLLNLTPLPFFIEVILAIAVLDLVIYAQHVAFHKISFLWRFHKVHHTDLDLDVSSGFRFHPLEIIISLAIKIGAVVLVGAPPVAVVLFEVILNLTSLFNHSNVHFHPVFDRLLRYVLVTPDMHRVHHSVIPAETDSNFCFNFPWWDKLFKTYKAQPQAGHQDMTIGLNQHQEPQKLTLLKIILLPFRS